MEVLAIDRSTISANDFLPDASPRATCSAQGRYLASPLNLQWIRSMYAPAY